MRDKKAEIYDVPKIENFRDIVDNSGRRYADEVAFLYHDGKSKIREVTYREAVEDIKALATYLNSQGLEGKKIAVSGKNSYGWAITYLAVTCGTGIIVPIDKDLRADEISFILGDSEASAILYGKEIECAVLGNEEPVASCLGEIAPSNDFYDYNAKYIDGKTVTYVPARITEKESDETF